MKNNKMELNTPYKYVVSVGCSMSHNFECTTDLAVDMNNLSVTETYGYLISKHFESEFTNLSAPAASMAKMNRKLLLWLGQHRDKFKDTLIIVGLTGLDRVEIWSNRRRGFVGGFPWPWPRHPHGDPNVTHTPPKTTYNEWLIEDRKEFFANFDSHESNWYNYVNTLIGLQSFFKLNNIDYIFTDCIHSFKEQSNPDGLNFGNKGRLYHSLYDTLILTENWYIHPEYKSFYHCVKENDYMQLDKFPHPNDEGHKYWSECLINFLERNNYKSQWGAM